MVKENKAISTPIVTVSTMNECNGWNTIGRWHTNMQFYPKSFPELYTVYSNPNLSLLYFKLISVFRPIAPVSLSLSWKYALIIDGSINTQSRKIHKFNFPFLWMDALQLQRIFHYLHHIFPKPVSFAQIISSPGRMCTNVTTFGYSRKTY